MKIESAGRTDVGLVRDVNQDRFLADESTGLFAVADGMGGHVGGEVAATTAIETLVKEFRRDRSPKGLVAALRAANTKIFKTGSKELSLRGMGTTVTAMAVFASDGKIRLYGVHVGDSRAYLGRGGRLLQLTSDHTLVEELVRRGHLTREEAARDRRRHTLTRAVGIEPDVAMETFELNVAPGDRILLCSDGLSNELTEEEIARLLFSSPDPAKVCNDLVEAARARGGRDNITVVVVFFDAAASDPGTPATLSRASRSGVVGPARAPRRERHPARPVREMDMGPPLFSFRTFLFGAVLGVIACAVYGTIFWFAHDTYYVGLYQGKVAVFKGMPSGQLWFKPEVVRVTNLNAGDLLPSEYEALSHGVVETSFNEAMKLVSQIQTSSSTLKIPSRSG
jgi:serine/threonine protein phosphatase PrpC